MTTLLNNTASVTSRLADASPSTQKRSEAMIANFKSYPSGNLPEASASLNKLSLHGIATLGHKTSTALPVTFDGYLGLIDDILKAPNQVAPGNTKSLCELPSRICEISLGVLDSTLRQSQSHEEYKRELVLDNLTFVEDAFLSCDDDIDEDLLSEGDIEECDSDDEWDGWDLDGHLHTPITVGMDYEMSLVDTVPSTSKYRHQQESSYRKEMLLDCVDDLDHILNLARCRDVPDEDDLSQGDVESVDESDGDFIPESLSDKYHTMDRCIVRITS